MKLFTKQTGTAYLQSGAIFFAVSVWASLSFTTYATAITACGAVLSGWFLACKLKKHEVLNGAFSALVPNVLLQAVYFSSMGDYIAGEATATLIALNILLVAMLGMVGGGIALGQRKYRDLQEKKEEHLRDRRHDTKWIDRVLVSVVLVFYVSAFVIPWQVSVSAASTCEGTSLSADEFIECFDPDTEYKPNPEANIESPTRRMPLEKPDLSQLAEQYPDITAEELEELWQACSRQASCTFGSLVQEYNDMKVSLRDNYGLLDPVNLQFKGMTYGIFHWQDRNSVKQSYIHGVWNSTQSWLNLGKEIVVNPLGTLQRVGSAIGTGLELYGSYQNLKFNLMIRDPLSYVWNVGKKIFQGNAREGLGDLFNVPNFLRFLVDRNYPGGSTKLLQQARDAKTWYSLGETAASMVVSQSTIQLVKQGDWRHAIAQGAGELATDGLVLGAIGKGLSMIPKVGEALGFMKKVKANPTELNAINKSGQKFFKKAPSKADNFVTTDLKNGGKSFSYEVPANNVPGSYAKYVKEVDKSGNTVTVYKTTYAPDGSIVHIKNK